MVAPLAEVITRWQPERLVVGVPYNADGTKQPLTEKVMTFVKALEQEFSLPVSCVDER